MSIKKRKQRKSLRWYCLTYGSTLLLAGGVYLLYVALNPFIRSELINPTDNTTTRLLGESGTSVGNNRLYIPKIDINLPYATGDATVMEQGAWWRKPDSGNPKDGGNFVLSAHRFIMSVTPNQTWQQSPFYAIDKLEVGDQIIVDYSGKRYTYVISDLLTVESDAVEIERPTEDSRLTLYSCTLGGAMDGRDVIVARPATLQ